MIIKEHANKLYLEKCYDHKNDLVVGVGSEVIAFGEVSGDSERFIHFKKSDWKNIKNFVDKKLDGSLEVENENW